MSKKHSQKKWVRNGIIIVAIVVLAGGIGVLARWLQTTVFKQAESSQEAPPVDDSAFFPPAVVESRNLEAQGKVDEANKKLEDAIAASTNKDDIYEFYFQLGVNYANQENFPKAIEVYRQAAALKETEPIYRAIGGAAERMGDKALAIESYRKAIPLLETSSPMYAAEKKRLEAYIQELGG